MYVLYFKIEYNHFLIKLHYLINRNKINQICQDNDHLADYIPTQVTS